MNPTTQSFGVTWPTGSAHAFIQGTIYQVGENHLSAAGLCGDQPYESLHDLIKLTRWTDEQAKTFIDHVHALVTNPNPKPRR